MGASGQTLYLKMEQNCIVYERSVKLQDIASVECTDVGILRQVLQEQVYYFSGNEKSSLVQVFSVLDVIRKIHEKYPTLEIENIGEPDFVIRYVPDPEKKAVWTDNAWHNESLMSYFDSLFQTETTSREAYYVKNYDPIMAIVQPRLDKIWDGVDVDTALEGLQEEVAQEMQGYYKIVDYYSDAK